MHPILFHAGHLIIPTFGPLVALGLMAAMWLSLRCAAPAGITPDALWNTTLFAVLAAFLLSRTLLVVGNLRSFLSYPLFVLSLPSLTSTGLFITAVATLLYLRIKRIPILSALDAWAAPAMLLWTSLALGHLAEGSDAGLPSTAPWAIRIPPDPDLQQPVALLVAVVALALTPALLHHLRRPHVPGHTAALALLLAGAAQFVLTFLRQPYPYAVDAVAYPLDPVQFVALGMIVTGGLVYALARYPQVVREPISHHAGAQTAAGEAR